MVSFLLFLCLLAPSFAGMDPDFEKSWGLVEVDAARAWRVSEGSSGVVVALIDSGIDLTHEELQKNIWTNPKEIPGNGMDDDGNGYVDDIHGWNFVQKSADIQDVKGHGTLVAGILAAEAENGKGSRGILRHTQLMVLRVLDRFGFGSNSAVAEAIFYAVKNGAQILNISFGGKYADPDLYKAVKWAGEQGVLIVAAAGNGGVDCDLPSNAIYPAAFPLPAVISVAGYDKQHRLAPFSNYGKESVHLGAPGVDIFAPAPGGGYRTVSGTSFAVPFVSAAAALLKSAEPNLSMSEIKSRILDTSEVIGFYEKERLQTAGRVHLANAVFNSKQPRPKPPSQWVQVEKKDGSAHPYSANEKSGMKIQQTGAEFIRVHFTQVETEQNTDYIFIKDGFGREVARYSGKKTDFWSAEAIGDTLFIDFQSDSSVQSYGFDVDAYAFSYELSPLSFSKRGEGLLKAASNARPQSGLEPILLERNVPSLHASNATMIIPSAIRRH